eukprot:scaffold176_cov356-Prasinococcus_capsulatus_cf.AAC.10
MRNNPGQSLGIHVLMVPCISFRTEPPVLAGPSSHVTLDEERCPRKLAKVSSSAESQRLALGQIPIVPKLKWKPTLSQAKTLIRLYRTSYEAIVDYMQSS